MDELSHPGPAATENPAAGALEDASGYTEDTVMAQLKLQRRMLFGIELTLLGGVLVVGGSAPLGLFLAAIGLVVALLSL